MQQPVLSINRVPSYEQSPLRPRSGGDIVGFPGIARVPSIERVPSKDACERSLHNDSGHGKSTVQIIRDLKANNTKLMDKMSTMEADFMNQIHTVTSQYEEQVEDLQESLEQRNKQLGTMADRMEGTEARIRERDAMCHKLKEETSFQRHTIADLKNQLYQLQHEVEEAAYNKRDEDDKWQVEKQEMAREMENLRNLVSKLEASGATSSSSGGVAEEKKSGEILESWKQVEETQRELIETKEDLLETKSALATLELETERVAVEHQTQTTSLQTELDKSRAAFTSQEAQLKEALETAGKYEETRKELDENVEKVKDLEAQVAEFTTQVTSLNSEVTKLRRAAERREAYRQEEAEDLRVLNDAQEEELHQLREICDELEREINEKDDALDEREDEVHEANKQVKELQLELASANERIDMADSAVVSALESKLKEYQKKCDKVEESKKELASKHEEVVKDLRATLESAKEANFALTERLERAEKSLEDSPQHTSRSLGDFEMVEEVESRAAKRLQESLEQAENEKAAIASDFKQRIGALMASKNEEILSLEKELASKEDQVERLQGKVEEEGIKSQKEVFALRRATAEQVSHIEKLQTALNATETEVKDVKLAKQPYEYVKELGKLREKIKGLEDDNEQLTTLRRELREAQVALVALDDEKRELDTERKTALKQTTDKLEALEEKHNKQLEAKLAAMEEELAEKHEMELAKARREKERAEAKEEDLRMQLEKKQTTITFLNAKAEKTRSVNSGDGMMEVALRKELVVAKESEDKYSSELAELKSKHDEQFAVMREKLEDRDTTISALVKASVTQETKVAGLKAEIGRLKNQLGQSGHTTERSASTIIQVQSSATEVANLQQEVANLQQEVETLNGAIGDYKEVETRLHKELDTLEKKLFEAERESHRLREQLDEQPGSPQRHMIAGLKKDRDTMLADHHEKLQERDRTIAQLVKQTVAQDELSKKHNEQLSRLTKELEAIEGGSRNRENGPSWDELRRLQKESEIFASQIIEQDEEMHALRTDLGDREAQVEKLKKDLSMAKKNKQSQQEDQDMIADLQAELDELQEANATKRQELRDLRRELREVKSKADNATDIAIELEQAQRSASEWKAKAEDLRTKETALQAELQELNDRLGHSETKLNLQQDSMRLMRQQAVDALELKVKEQEEMIETLQAKVDEEAMGRKDATIERLTKEIERQNLDIQGHHDALDALQKKLLEKEEELEQPRVDEEKEELKKRIDELERDMEVLAEDKLAIDDMKLKLTAAEDIRLSSEKGIVDSYERKISLLKLNKDVTIDTLRKELLEAKSSGKDAEDDLARDIQGLKMENKDLRDEMEAKLELKNTKIHALEQTLGAQEQLVENMRQEMDHLQNSMERSTIGRRAEIEEMQQEVIDASARTQKQEREIGALRMKLEETELKYKAEVTKLEDKLAASSAPVIRTNPEDVARLAEVKERLEEMKWRNTKLQDQNTALRERLGEAETTSSELKNDKYRASALEDEVSNLRKKVNELEEEKTVWKATPPPPQQSGNTSRSGSSSRPPKSSSSAPRGANPPGRRSISSGRRFPSPLPSKNSNQDSPLKGSKARRSSKMTPPASPLANRFFRKRTASSDKGDDPLPSSEEGSASSKLTF
eukprot:CAMPEP_0194069804 /NCGR_PEP_ID=MMETSP0009_2-20130614/87838_1 /TAXON_ID=210454 /ORGANISM="Grammatophora oceanica, Strain CCMP 410" /LENGTH=1630 /DNA_ID=CAMNT_0038723025 /DNA_START=486 /DNA_END=5378 /DNA_ORIENTATION=+